MTKKQKRVERVVKRLQEYMNTYNEQVGYLDYSDETIIKDVLYGLGIALRPKHNAWATGFRKFKEELKKYL